MLQIIFVGFERCAPFVLVNKICFQLLPRLIKTLPYLKQTFIEWYSLLNSFIISENVNIMVHRSIPDCGSAIRDPLNNRLSNCLFPVKVLLWDVRFIKYQDASVLKNFWSERKIKLSKRWKWCSKPCLFFSSNDISNL